MTNFAETKESRRMDEELPAALITPEERWLDFAAALNALGRFAGREAEREHSRTYERTRKAEQREKKRANADARPMQQDERLIG